MSIKKFFFLFGLGFCLTWAGGSDIGKAVVPGDQLGAGSTSYMSTTNSLSEVSAAGSAAQAVSRTNLGLGSAATNSSSAFLPSSLGNATSTTPGLEPTYSTPVITIVGAAGRALVTSTASTGFQLSSTCNSHVSYSVSVSTTATIGGASAGLISLQTCPTNSTTPSAWTTVNSVGNSQAITLAIALNSVQVTQTIIVADVPAGYYVRLLSTGSGTFANSLTSGCEKVDSTGY